MPTEEPEESDGTLEVEFDDAWCSSNSAAAAKRASATRMQTRRHARRSINGMLKEVLLQQDALQTPARYADMIAKIRNNGREGITAMAVSAVDIALWDFKGKLLGKHRQCACGERRESGPVYGSGGFTSYSASARLTEQLGGWVHDMRIPRVKMKVGRDPHADPKRVACRA